MWEGNGCWEMHKRWCRAKKLEWIECIVCTVKYAVHWKHKCYHKFCINVQRITERLKTTVVTFARINIDVKQMIPKARH